MKNLTIYPLLIFKFIGLSLDRVKNNLKKNKSKFLLFKASKIHIENVCSYGA